MSKTKNDCMDGCEGLASFMQRCHRRSSTGWDRSLRKLYVGGGERERENSNSKTLFYKDCSLGSVKILTTSPC